MGLQFEDALVSVFVGTAGVLLIVAALLQQAGNRWFISPNRFPRRLKKRHVPVGASLLLGASMVLGGGTRMIAADYQRVWALWLLPVCICLGIASLTTLLSVRKPRHDSLDQD